MTPQAPLQGRGTPPRGYQPPPRAKRAVAPARAQQSGASRWTLTGTSPRGGGGTPPPPTREHAHMGDTTAWAPSTRRPRRRKAPLPIDSHGQRTPLQRPTLAPYRGAWRRARPLPTPVPRMASPWGKGSRAACFPRPPLRWPRRVTTRGGGFAPLGRPRWTPGGRVKSRFSARFRAGGPSLVFF